MPRNLKISFIDVGQGDCTLITTPNHKNILIDGGGSNDLEKYDVGKQVLLPYLLNHGIKQIDIMIISHFDSDHVGGLFYILEQLEVKKVIISKQGENSENYQEFKKIIGEKRIEVFVLKKGDTLKIENNLNIKILWPREEQIQENILNNNSIVAKLEYKTFSMLLTGDIEKMAEEQIIEEYENTNILYSTVLKVAHHGSKTSSTKEFLELVKPKIALIGVGKNNLFGHPNEEVIERLNNFRTKIYRTDLNGEIRLQINKSGEIKIHTML